VTTSGAGPSDGALRRFPLAGGDAIELAAGLADPRAVAVGAAIAYVALWTDGQILAVPTGGGSPAVMASNQSHPQALVVNGKYLYWLNAGSAADDGAVMRMPLAGGTPASLVIRQRQPEDLFVDLDTLYFTSRARTGGGLFRLSEADAGGVAEQIFSGRSVGIAGDARYVYFTSWSLDASKPFEGAVARLDRQTGAVGQLVPEQSSPAALALREGRLYWTNETAFEARSAAATGGDSVVLGPASVSAIAVDGTSVYFTATRGDLDGVVLKAPR
jgi:hypothetical protein